MAKLETIGSGEDIEDDLPHDSIPAYLSAHQKIELGTVEKERGNELFKEAKYEEAKKKYDLAFVNIFCSKEEWENMSASQRNEINQFKLPCHLNRGFARIKLNDLKNALWDFSEALRIDDSNIKARYRRGLVYTALAWEEIKKEGREYWDLDKTKNLMENAKNDLRLAIESSPQDRTIRKAYSDLEPLAKELSKFEHKYQEKRRDVFTGFFNSSKTDEHDQSLYDTMPTLERIDIM